MTEEASELLAALERWRTAKPNSAEERKAAKMLAYRSAVLLRSLGVANA